MTKGREYAPGPFFWPYRLHGSASSGIPPPFAMLPQDFHIPALAATFLAAGAFLVLDAFRMLQPSWVRRAFAVSILVVAFWLLNEFMDSMSV